MAGLCRLSPTLPVFPVLCIFTLIESSHIILQLSFKRCEECICLTSFQHTINFNFHEVAVALCQTEFSTQLCVASIRYTVLRHIQVFAVDKDPVCVFHALENRGGIASESEGLVGDVGHLGVKIRL